MAAIQSETQSYSWRSRLVLGVWVLALFLLPLLSHAGGLGIAPLAAIIGGVGLFVSVGKGKVLPVPVWLLALIAFLVWAFISQLWSPYEEPNTLSNPFKLGLGVALYLSALLTARRFSNRDRVGLGWLLALVSTVILALLAIDILSNYALSRAVDPLKQGENISMKNLRVIMNLGHSAAILSVLWPMAAVFIWMKAQRYRYVVLMIPLVLMGLSVLAGLSVGVIAPLISLMVMLAAFRAPKQTLYCIFILAGLSIILAPLLGVLSSFLLDILAGQIPYSWEHRLTMWAYSTEKILEQPWIGHGFDAVRTFDRTMDHPNFPTWRVMSLHPHNFGLHIWLETGIVGIVLAILTLVLIARRVITWVGRNPMKSALVSGVLVAMIIIGNVSYGVWQDWVWALFILTSTMIAAIFSPQ